MKKIVLLTIASVIGVACTKSPNRPFNKQVNFRNKFLSQTEGVLPSPDPPQELPPLPFNDPLTNGGSSTVNSPEEIDANDLPPPHGPVGMLPLPDHPSPPPPPPPPLHPLSSPPPPSPGILSSTAAPTSARTTPSPTSPPSLSPEDTLDFKFLSEILPTRVTTSSAEGTTNYNRACRTSEQYVRILVVNGFIGDISCMLQSRSAPFVEITIGDDVRKTSVINSRSPSWNQYLDFGCQDPSYKITIAVNNDMTKRLCFSGVLDNWSAKSNRRLAGDGELGYTYRQYSSTALSAVQIRVLHYPQAEKENLLSTADSTDGSGNVILIVAISIGCALAVCLLSCLIYRCRSCLCRPRPARTQNANARVAMPESANRLVAHGPRPSRPTSFGVIDIPQPSAPPLAIRTPVAVPALPMFMGTGDISTIMVEARPVDASGRNASEKEGVRPPSLPVATREGRIN